MKASAVLAVPAAAGNISVQDLDGADGNLTAVKEDVGGHVKADGVAGKPEQSAVKENRVAQSASASATSPVAQEMVAVPAERRAEAEPNAIPAQAEISNVSAQGSNAAGRRH